MNIDKGDNIILKVARLVMILVMLLSFFISGCVELPTEEQTWYVDIRGDADFSDIQTAIEAAADGDIVLVAEGLYQSSVNISKSLTVQSVEDTVVIRGDGTQEVITIDADSVILSGFRIENGSKGIVVYGNNCTLTFNYVVNNSVGIELSDDSRNQVIYNNYFDNDINIIGFGTSELNILPKIGKNIIGGSLLGGNYWNDYIGYDLDKDGIGDTQLPYTGALKWLDGGDLYPMTNRIPQSSIYVDDDYNVDAVGWGVSHFSSLQLAVEATQEGGIIQIAQGSYEGPIVLNRTLILVGEDKKNTVITSSEGLGHGKPLIQIMQPDCIISNLSINIVSEVTGRVGIDIESQNTIIKNVMIHGFEYGIRILYAKGTNTIDATKIQNCNTGIYTSYTGANIIKNCEIQNSTLYGIFLNAGSDDNLVEGNSISQSGYGMRIKSSTLNLIINNSILDNNKGMYFCCGARNNTVTRNRFINNTDWHASDQYNNIWNKEAVGNYWDDYSGSDTNGDGIGEVVYTISEGYSSDEFPIVAQSFFND